MAVRYTFETEIWQYQGKDPWYFVTLPKDYRQEIKALTADFPNKGFGSVKVKATIDSVSWDTSIFPDNKADSYLMPIKKDVRTKLGVDAGDRVAVSIELQDI